MIVLVHKWSIFDNFIIWINIYCISIIRFIILFIAIKFTLKIIVWFVTKLCCLFFIFITSLHTNIKILGYRISIYTFIMQYVLYKTWIICFGCMNWWRIVLWIFIYRLIVIINIWYNLIFYEISIIIER